MVKQIEAKRQKCLFGKRAERQKLSFLRTKLSFGSYKNDKKCPREYITLKNIYKNRISDTSVIFLRKSRALFFYKEYL